MKKIVFVLLFISGVLTTVSAQVKVGLASYYHNKWHGRRTTSGERYHKDSLTCAHKTYPFGTRLRVTCFTTGKTVTVRVNDRGPHRKTRIIDLSYAAARQIGMIHLGITKVRVEKLN
ncbi:MAG: septal ring lytic transglycosylase RlpA family protein [Flavobacteriaceae bacterium]|nr:septal ring lytic transglycosylase RlpA family protein [Flavobacteriaceae bacterium]